MLRSQAQDVIRCQYCEEELAQFHCVPCGDELCPRCKTLHLKSKVPTGHNVIPISERLEPTNMIKMCESHASKPYDACCEECQVPVCIFCIHDIHNKHKIGKLQDMYEKHKTKAVKNLSELKMQKRADVIERIKDVENREKQIITNQENMKKKMTKQAKDIIDDVNAILNAALDESESDKMKNLEKLSEHKAELEEYQWNLEHTIENIENLTESCHPADLILYWKQNPDVVKQLKCPDTVVTTDPTFTVGHIDKSLNEKQFGQMNKLQFNRVKERDRSQMKTSEFFVTENIPATFNIKDVAISLNENEEADKRPGLDEVIDSSDEEYDTASARYGEEIKDDVSSDEEESDVTSEEEGEDLQFKSKSKTNSMKAYENRAVLPKTKFRRSVMLSEIDLGMKVVNARHMACIDAKRAYTTGSGSEIILIDRFWKNTDTVATLGEPSALAVMENGSLIYSVYDKSAIYQFRHERYSIKLLNTRGKPKGMCYTRSGEILVCLSRDTRFFSLFPNNRVAVAWYNISGEEIHQFEINRHSSDDMETEWPICENVNGDVCIASRYSFNLHGNRVEVYAKSGKNRFNYSGHGLAPMSYKFEPRGLATDRLGHILISDNTNHVVHLISQDGDFIMEILTKEDGISRPLGIAVDKFEDVLLIDRDGVKVYAVNLTDRYRYRFF